MCVCVCKINCHLLNSPLQCGWLKITCHLLNSPLQCGWLKITCHLLNSPLQCGWLTITFHLNTMQPLAVNWVTCEALGSSTCMQIECVITYHAMDTASCHIHRNLLHTPHTLTHCVFKHSMYTFSCRLFRESSQVCVPGLEIITRVKNLLLQNFENCQRMHGNICDQNKSNEKLILNSVDELYSDYPSNESSVIIISYCIF